MNPLAAELRDERRARGVSQAKLAERIGIHTSQLCDYERCKQAPSGPILIAWIMALGFDVLGPPRGRR